MDSDTGATNRRRLAQKSERWIRSLKNGNPFALFSWRRQGFDMRWLGGFFEALWAPPEQGTGEL